MVQLRDEEQATKHQAMLISGDTLEADERVAGPEITVSFDRLFDEPEIEEQENFARVKELQHDFSAETVWAQIEAAFPQYTNAIPNATVEQVDHAVTVVTEVRHTRESSVESVAGAKQVHKHTEKLQEVDEIALAGRDAISDSVELQDETRMQIAQPEGKQFIIPDVELPQNMTPPASPTISQRGATLRAILDDGDDNTPASPASQPPLAPRHNPAPSSKPRTSNAPPNYAPVKTRKSVTKKPITAKEPRKQPLSPNSLLPDDDKTKLWCICREIDDGEKMVMCAEPHCKAKWFHFGCVGLERSPPKEEDWWCFDHRKMTARQKTIAERERKEGEKGVAKVVKRKVQDEAEDDDREEERPAKKTKTKVKSKTKAMSGAKTKGDKTRIQAGTAASEKRRSVRPAV